VCSRKGRWRRAQLVVQAKSRAGRRPADADPCCPWPPRSNQVARVVPEPGRPPRAWQVILGQPGGGRRHQAAAVAGGTRAARRAPSWRGRSHIGARLAPRAGAGGSSREARPPRGVDRHPIEVVARRDAIALPGLIRPIIPRRLRGGGWPAPRPKDPGVVWSASRSRAGTPQDLGQRAPLSILAQRVGLAGSVGVGMTRRWRNSLTMRRIAPASGRRTVEGWVRGRPGPWR